MNAMTSVVCAAFLGLGLLGSGLQQQPQGKEPQAAVILPGLADALKGYVGQECWVNWGGAPPITISMNDQKSPAKYKIEMVGRDFLKLSGEMFIPFSQIGSFQGKKS
jgi:hypothetical protein